MPQATDEEFNGPHWEAHVTVTVPAIRNPGAHAARLYLTAQLSRRHPVRPDLTTQDLINRLVDHIAVMHTEADEIAAELGNFHAEASDIRKQQASHRKKRVAAWNNYSTCFNEKTSLL